MLVTSLSLSKPSQAPLLPSEVKQIVHEAITNDRLARDEALRIGNQLGDPTCWKHVLEAADESKRRAKGNIVSVSKNVFIPLTNLCRDRCAYCTFSKNPDSPEAKTYTLEEVAQVVAGGIRTGCIEALFCLGDKPEVAYKAHREWLASKNYRSTADHLVDGCKVAFEGGLLPHTNAGILSGEEMEQLRMWNPSIGLMLENVSPRLRGKGMPHQYAPDKDPELRLRMHREAGELKLPFTTGILLGIGENVEERVDTLFAIRDLSDHYGHIQETIIQPFHPKPGTPMRYVSALPDEEIAGWVALSRLVLGSKMNLQAPPNLTPHLIELLLRSGVNDWGGVSPVTLDFINPEAPWPTLKELRRRTEAADQRLVERLPVYPDHLAQPEFFDARVRERALTFAGSDGFAKPASPREEEAA